VYATAPVDTASNPIAIQAEKEHLDAYGEKAGAFYQNAYAAILAVVNAIDAANSTEYDAVMAALKSEYVDTSIGNISFDARGDAIGAGFSVYQVKNGEFVQLD